MSWAWDRRMVAEVVHWPTNASLLKGIHACSEGGVKSGVRTCYF